MPWAPKSSPTVSVDCFVYVVWVMAGLGKTAMSEWRGMVLLGFLLSRNVSFTDTGRDRLRIEPTPRQNSKRVFAGALLVSPSFRKSKEPQLIPF